MLYKLQHIVQRYGNHTALDMRHMPPLAIDRGSVLALTGPNGAGKSTLLRILAFLEQPAEGTLSFYGNTPMHSRKDVTLLLQEPYLFKTTVLNNVCYGLKMRGKKEGMREKALEALATVGFKHNVVDRPWYQLSGGEKQRVALAARLVLKPLALLLDEPTAHTDESCSAAIHEAVHHAAAKGTTVIVSSHDKLWLESLNARYVELKTTARDKQ